MKNTIYAFFLIFIVACSNDNKPTVQAVEVNSSTKPVLENDKKPVVNKLNQKQMNQIPMH
jgi:hypothetical protein